MATGILDPVNTPRPLVVYIVDDDASVRTALSRLMRSAGFVPMAFENPRQFLGEVSIEHPACLLLDMTMPHASGLEVQAQLREREIALPVIGVSAHDDEGTRRLARELGVQFFLRKPVDDQALFDAIAWVTAPNDER